MECKQAIVPHVETPPEAHRGPGERLVRRVRDDAPAWLMSLVVHFSVLIVIGLVLGRATSEPIVVSLDASEKVYLNDHQIPSDELSARLPALLERSPERAVLFRAERTLPYERVLAVIVDIQAGGAKNIVMASDLRGK